MSRKQQMEDCVRERIIKRMNLLKYKQTELAAKAGINVDIIKNMVNKGSTPGGVALVLIANALKTTPYYLIGETDDPDPNNSHANPSESVMYHLSLKLLTQLDDVSNEQKAKAISKAYSVVCQNQKFDPDYIDGIVDYMSVD